jgi:hypothetical protein
VQEELLLDDQLPEHITGRNEDAAAQRERRPDALPQAHGSPRRLGWNAPLITCDDRWMLREVSGW